VPIVTRVALNALVAATAFREGTLHLLQQLLLEREHYSTRLGEVFKVKNALYLSISIENKDRIFSLHIFRVVQKDNGGSGSDWYSLTFAGCKLTTTMLLRITILALRQFKWLLAFRCEAPVADSMSRIQSSLDLDRP
jgi:hypothetical protein